MPASEVTPPVTALIGVAAVRKPLAFALRLLGDRWLVPIIYFLCAAAFCLRLLADPAHRVVAGNPGDQALISYFLQAQPTALLHGHNPLLLTTMNAPDGVNMMWNTGLLLPAILLAPLSLTLGGNVTFVLLLLAGLAGSAWTAYLVLRRLTRRRVPAFVGGLVYGFSPAMTHQAIGHLQLVVAFLVPLILDALINVLTGPFRWATAVGLGGLSAAQLLTGEEVLACAAIAGALMTLVLTASRPRLALRQAGPALRGLAVAGAVFAFFACLPLAFQFFGPRQQRGSPFGFDLFKSDLTSFVTPDKQLLLHTAANVAAFPGVHPERDAFLGWPLLVLLAVITLAQWGDLRVRVAAACATTLACFSLGGTLLAGGTGTTVHLPWAHLQRAPLLGELLPNRFGLLVAGFVGAALAIALDTALDLSESHRGRQLAMGALVAAVLLPLLPPPLQTIHRLATPDLIASGDSHRYLPNGSTVLTLPFPTPADTTAMDWQADDGLRWSMPGGYFIGPPCHGRHCSARAYLGPNNQPTAVLLEQIGDNHGPARGINSQDIARAARDLNRWHVTRVLIGPSPRQQQLAAAMTTLLGRPATAIDGCLLWTLPTNSSAADRNHAS
jgi:hypothetical protein